MPYSVAQSDRCPASRPWAVTKDSDGQLMGCHATKADAQKQVAALHASEESNVNSTLASIDPRSMHRLCYRSVEFRAAGEPGDGRTLEGYAAVFNQPTRIQSFEGDFDEVIRRGAFRKTLTERTPVMQFDHGNDKRTGSTPIGAIQELHEDDYGLFVRARLFDNELVEPIRQAVEGGAIRGMSFKFRVVRDNWLDSAGERIAPDELADMLADGEPVTREIREVELFELGPVVFPAYQQTSVGVRSVFDPGQVALRGVIAQFGLDSRCIKRHLSIFDEDARRALAEEIADSFPELLDVINARAKAGEPEPIETSPEPEQPTRGREAEPVASHSERIRETADWYLPVSNKII